MVVGMAEYSCGEETLDGKDGGGEKKCHGAVLVDGTIDEAEDGPYLVPSVLQKIVVLSWSGNISNKHVLVGEKMV